MRWERGQFQEMEIVVKIKIGLIFFVFLLGVFIFRVSQSRERRCEQFIDLFSQYIYSGNFEIESIRSHSELIFSTRLDFKMWVKIDGDSTSLIEKLLSVKNNKCDIRSSESFDGIMEYKKRFGEYPEFLWTAERFPNFYGKIKIVGSKKSNLFYVYGWTEP